MKKQPDREKLFASACALDGRDEALRQWVTDSGAVALISDNFGSRRRGAAMPRRFLRTLPLHAHCLFKLGCYLGEMFWLTELADWLRANGRNRFLFTGPPCGCRARSIARDTRRDGVVRDTRRDGVMRDFRRGGVTWRIESDTSLFTCSRHPALRAGRIGGVPAALFRGHRW